MARDDYEIDGCPAADMLALMSDSAADTGASDRVAMAIVDAADMRSGTAVVSTSGWEATLVFRRQ